MTFDISIRMETPLTNLMLSAPTYLSNISSIDQSMMERIAGQTHKQTDLLHLVVWK